MPEKLTAVLHIRVTPRVWDEMYRRANEMQCDISEMLRETLERAMVPVRTPPASGNVKNTRNP